VVSVPDPAAVRAAIAAVPDPELPVVTIEELGILRSVVVDGSRASVTITPTYSGCPALEAIRADVIAAAGSAGATAVDVRTVLAPAWTTDWITAGARAKLAAHGIAPPSPAPRPGTVAIALSVRCPQCGSLDTREQSRFSGTACKSLWSCVACREPFEHLKAI
jgi:ring-1,2-phenylacetyl-CoA epoxidase subunit PaaD